MFEQMKVEFFIEQTKNAQNFITKKNDAKVKIQDEIVIIKEFENKNNINTRQILLSCTQNTVTHASAVYSDTLIQKSIDRATSYIRNFEAFKFYILNDIFKRNGLSFFFIFE